MDADTVDSMELRKVRNDASWQGERGGEKEREVKYVTRRWQPLLPSFESK